MKQEIWIILYLAIKEIESIIKNFPTKKPPGLDDFTGELYQRLVDELIWMLTQTLSEFAS